MLATSRQWFDMVREKADFEEYLRDRHGDHATRLRYAKWLEGHGMKQRAVQHRIAAAAKLDMPPSFQGDFFAQAYKRHANGDREPLWSASSVNLTTLQGRAYVLGTGFNSGTQEANWYFAPINGASTPTISTADTYQSHAGWTEVTAYSEATRQQWSPTFTSNVATNVDTPATITASASATIYGNAIVSNNTKGASGAGETLWCAGAYTGGSRTLVTASELDLYYALTLV